MAPATKPELAAQPTNASNPTGPDTPSYVGPQARHMRDVTTNETTAAAPPMAMVAAPAPNTDPAA